jgi:hypothetical protein
MDNFQQIGGIQYLGVRFSLEGMANMHGARTVLSISKQDLRRIRLEYGVPGERWWLELLIGLVLLGVVGLQGLSFLSWLVFGGKMYDVCFVIPLICAGAGGWLVWDAVRKQWYLAVETDQKVCKVSFDENPKIAELSAFLQGANQLGYSIDLSPLQKQPM